jgi:hypothetical protein
MKYLIVIGMLGFSLISSGQSSMPRQRTRSPGQVPSGESGPDLLADFHGTLTSLTSKTLVLTLDDSKKGEENTMELSLSRKTVAMDGDKKIKVTDLKTGQSVDVEAKRQIDGSMEAVTIHLDRP